MFFLLHIGTFLEGAKKEIQKLIFLAHHPTISVVIMKQEEKKDVEIMKKLLTFASDFQTLLFMETFAADRLTDFGMCK